MSRAIKFRIWDKKHQRWFQGSTDPKSIALQTDAIDLFGEIIVFGEILHDQHEDNVWKDDPDIKSSIDVMEWLEVCQYTGLKDKNGREIYEGDIVEGDMGVFEVEWYGLVARFMFTPNVDMKWHPPFVYEQVKEMEVIGNIHENPELVEEI